MGLPRRRKPFSIPCGPSCYSNPTSSGPALPSGTKCSIFGWTPIRLPGAFENAVLWNWSCGDSNRRPNAARAAIDRQSAENPPGGAQGPFAAGLRSNGGADPARNPATRAGDPRGFEQRPGTTDSELNSFCLYDDAPGVRAPWWPVPGGEVIFASALSGTSPFVVLSFRSPPPVLPRPGG